MIPAYMLTLFEVARFVCLTLWKTVLGSSERAEQVHLNESMKKPFLPDWKEWFRDSMKRFINAASWIR